MTALALTKKKLYSQLSTLSLATMKALRADLHKRITEETAQRLFYAMYPGRRFEQPTRVWAAGKTNETTRDIIQATLLGEVKYRGKRRVVSGTGVVPGAMLSDPSWKQGVSDLVDTIKVRHVSGGWSVLGLKAYNQGRGSFEGTAQHVIWLDEEPPMDVYGECLIRTATTNGIIMLTFTPLSGMSEVVLQFMPAEFRPDMSD